MSKFPGLTISIPLFFKNNGEIDYLTLQTYIERLAESNSIAAIYSMAYNTRYRMLEPSEVLEVNSFILKLAKKVGLKCYVGHPYIVNENSFSRYLEQIANLEPAGISMLYPERYYGIDDAILDFLTFPGKFGLNTVIHEMKFVSGFNGELVDWPIELIKNAMALDKVVAIKEDSKNDDITSVVLEESLRRNVECVLAGGGKRRALKFMPQGLRTWLNGTTMFFPQAIDKIYTAMIENNKELIDFYCENIEAPFFDRIVSKHGWHLSHKAALEFYGFGIRAERFPHPIISDSSYGDIAAIFEDLRKNIELFNEL